MAEGRSTETKATARAPGTAARANPPSKFVPRRGRPTSKQAAAIEQVILDVAREEFLTNGYANTSMESVASSAGVSKGTLYARYAGKESLFDAVVSDRLTVWRSQHPLVLPDPGEGASAMLFRTATAFLRRLRDPEINAFHRLIAAEAPRFPELAKQFYDLGFHGMIGRLTAALETESQARGSPAANAHSVAKAFLSALIGWLDTEMLQRQPEDDDCAAFAAGLTAVFTVGRASW